MSEYADNCAAHARAHADKAEELADKAGSKFHNRDSDMLGVRAARATAHATLALYWQKEADR